MNVKSTHSYLTLLVVLCSFHGVVSADDRNNVWQTSNPSQKSEASELKWASRPVAPGSATVSPRAARIFAESKQAESKPSPKPLPPAPRNPPESIRSRQSAPASGGNSENVGTPSDFSTLRQTPRNFPRQPDAGLGGFSNSEVVYPDAANPLAVAPTAAQPTSAAQNSAIRTFENPSPYLGTWQSNSDSFERDRPQISSNMMKSMQQGGQPVARPVHQPILQPSLLAAQARAGENVSSAPSSPPNHASQEQLTNKYPLQSKTNPAALHHASHTLTNADSPANNEVATTTAHRDSVGSSPNDAVSAPKSDRFHLASIVSSRILGQGSSDVLTGPPQRIDASIGWGAIEEQLNASLRESQALLDRNAYFSAHEEAEKAARALLRQLDSRSHTNRHEQAWLQAKRALQEANTFSTSQSVATEKNLLQWQVESHLTPILKGKNMLGVSPGEAVQHYHLFAERSIIEAASGHPWASDIFYLIGRIYQAQAESREPQDRSSLFSKAVVFYKAAVAISQNNSLAANQLAFIYLQLDKPLDARRYLELSIQAQPSLEAYQNLYETSQRIGDTRTMQWAFERAGELQRNLSQNAGNNAIQFVEPNKFAAMSPYPAGQQFSSQAEK